MIKYLLKVIRHILCFVLKLIAVLLKRLINISLYEISWILTAILFYSVLFNTEHEKDEKSIVNNARSIQPLNPRKLSREADKSKNPVISWWTGGLGSSKRTRNCSNKLCDVFGRVNSTNIKAYLFYASLTNFSDLPLPRRPGTIIWGLSHEESPRNILELSHEPPLNLFNFSTTFSRYSEVPFPLQYIGSLNDVTSVKHFVETRRKNIFSDQIAPVLYLQTDCHTATERDAYVSKLMELIPIDSYGGCLKNKQLPSKFLVGYLNHLNEFKFLKFIARYKFVVAIENGICDDYVTEKFWRAIKVGTVPIYFGSPTIRDWMPNDKSAILLQDFPTPELMSEHLKTLINNDSLYEEYLEHKTKGIISNKRLVVELKARPYQTDCIKRTKMFECFICQRLHEKKDKSEVNVVTKSHYNCPKPVSALTQQINPANEWVRFWESNDREAMKLYQRVMYNSQN